MVKLIKRIALTAGLMVLEALDNAAVRIGWVGGSDWANALWGRGYQQLDGLVNGPR